MTSTQAPPLSVEDPRKETGRPLLSVVVAVHNGAAVLSQCLHALRASEFPRERWELVVVDDASTDESVLVAAEYADIIVRLPGKPRGPAYARNRGSEVSCGEIVVFVDADVCVHRDVLGGFASFFDKMPWVSAAFGSYDVNPSHPGIVSQFRNLLHHYVHQSSPGEAETFWSGCGAVRKTALLDIGMFDEWHYSRPQIEDIDMGRRLRRAGYRIVLRPEIQCTHLKQWTLGGVLTADLTSRGVPWMRMLLQEEVFAEFQALNLRFKERLCAGLSLLTCIFAISAVLWRQPMLLGASAMLVMLVLMLNVRFYSFLLQVRGPWQALASVPLHLLFYITAAVAAAGGYLAHILFGEPSASPEVEAESAMELKFWPPCPRKPDTHLWRSIASPRRTDL